METKPTYEELEIYIKKLEKQVLEINRYHKKIEESQNIFNLLRLSPHAIFLIDLSGKIIFANEIGAENLGKTPGEIAGTTLRDYFPSDISENRRLKGVEAVMSGNFQRFEDQVGDRYFDTTIIPMKDEKGKPTHLAIYSEDVTERMKTQVALQQREEFLKNIFNAIQDGISILDTDLKIVRVNPWMENMYSQEVPLVGKKCYRAYQNRDTPCPWCPTLKTIETGETHSTVVPYPDEKDPIGWIDLSAFPLKDVEGNVIGVIEYVKDISEQRKAEEGLRESEERYRLFVESANEGIILTQEGKLRYINPRALEFIGYSEKEMLSRSFLEFVHPDDQNKIVELYAAKMRGEEVPPGLSYRIIDKKEEVKWVQSRSTLLTWKGKPSLLTFMTDITHQKQLESHIQQAQKMEAIGTLAGGIAHDFNNLLMGIQGNASLMLLDVETQNPHYEKLKSIEQYVQNGAELTKQLLGFARGGKYEVKATNINDLINESAGMFGRTRKDIQIHKKLTEEPWTTEVDQGQIGQVLLNLYVNAWQAMPGGGELYLQTENVVLDEGYVTPFGVQPGKYVKISVTDAGAGMDEATKQRVFDPFFTTKEMGRGTGLGLASAYGIVKNHDGIINVYSEKGEGTTFNIYLPASKKAMIKEKESTPEILEGSETVLLVDDEQMVIDVGVPMLEKLGYKVMSVTGGRAAIELYKEKMDEIDIVILDMIMPEMNGGETYDQLKEINPDIKVLLSSGYSINGQAQEILYRGCDGFIQKPFKLIDLSQKLREILDQG